MASIEQFKGPYHFLSNFYLIPVQYEGVIYRSVEHGFQAAKTVYPQEREVIRMSPTPSVAKRRGRECTKRLGWETLRLTVMEDLLRNKFSNIVMKGLLLKTGDALLVEGNTWHDQFWGSCTCPMHVNKIGENMLGQLLMKIRKDLVDGQH